MRGAWDWSLATWEEWGGDRNRAFSQGHGRRQAHAGAREEQDWLTGSPGGIPAHDGGRMPRDATCPTGATVVSPPLLALTTPVPACLCGLVCAVDSGSYAADPRCSFSLFYTTTTPPSGHLGGWCPDSHSGLLLWQHPSEVSLPCTGERGWAVSAELSRQQDPPNGSSAGL